MAVDDHGLEVIRKSAEYISGQDRSDYFLKTGDANGLLGGITYDYVGVTYPTTTSEVYTFRVGGSGGTVSRVVTLIYTDSTKENLSSAERTS